MTNKTQQTMKTLTMEEAVKQGYRTFRYGMNRYIPAALPRGFDYHTAGLDVLLDQWERCFEDPEATEESGGYCVQCVEDTRGRLGLRGTVYIVRCYYDRQDGCQDWTYYAAVKI